MHQAQYEKAKMISYKEQEKERMKRKEKKILKLCIEKAYKGKKKQQQKINQR